MVRAGSFFFLFTLGFKATVNAAFAPATSGSTLTTRHPRKGTMAAWQSLGPAFCWSDASLWPIRKSKKGHSGHQRYWPERSRGEKTVGYRRGGRDSIAPSVASSPNQWWTVLCTATGASNLETGAARPVPATPPSLTGAAVLVTALGLYSARLFSAEKALGHGK